MNMTFFYFDFQKAFDKVPNGKLTLIVKNSALGGGGEVFSQKDE